MPALPQLLISGIALLLFSVSPIAAAASATIPWAPYVAYGQSKQGSLTTVGLVLGDDAVRFASGVAFFDGSRIPMTTATRSLDFTNLDVSVRFGRFDEFSFYGEVGLALDELLMDNLKHHDDTSYGQQDDTSNLPDPFVGIAAGFDQQHWSLTAFGQYRYLPSYQDEWQRMSYASREPLGNADVHQWFAGVEFSLRF